MEGVRQDGAFAKKGGGLKIAVEVVPDELGLEVVKGLIKFSERIISICKQQTESCINVPLEIVNSTGQ